MLREALAAGLGVDGRYIDKLAKTSLHQYKEYSVPKRTGGNRLIQHPARPLKAAQRWLQQHVVSRLPVHPAAAAYRLGRNIADHARLHLTSRYLLRIDLEDFFGSIRSDDIAALLNDHRQRLPATWSEADTLLFVALVCRHNRLTVGAVTSPGLSNAICFNLDVALTSKAGPDVVYTRYADDLFFSTSRSNVLSLFPAIVQEALTSIKYPKALQINESKTRHSSLKRRRRVTGLILSSQGTLSTGRGFKRRVRSLVYRLDSLTLQERATLAGLLAYVRDVEPQFLNTLVIKYGEKAIEATKMPLSLK